MYSPTSSLNNPFFENNDEQALTAFSVTRVQGEPALAVITIQSGQVIKTEYKRIEDTLPLAEILEAQKGRL